MRWSADAVALSQAVRAGNPGLPLVVVGHSMGGGVALLAAADGLDADALVLAGPAIAGGDALNPISRSAARALAAALPEERWTGRGLIAIHPTDNPAALDRVRNDPRHFGDPSSRELYGLVELMDRAAAAAPAVAPADPGADGRPRRGAAPGRGPRDRGPDPRRRRLHPLPRRLALAVPRPAGAAGLERRRRVRALGPPALGAGAALVISRPLLQHPAEPRETALPDPEIPAPQRSDEIRKTTCYMCACRCGIDVHLKDGKVRYIEGNRDHPVNRGVLCAKGAAGHHAALLARPGCARRCGASARAAPASSEEIAWDEALGIATDWLAPLRETAPGEARLLHRPRPVAVASPASGRSSSARRTTPPMAASARSTWPPPASTRSAARSGSSARPTGSARKLFVLFGVAEDHDCNPIKIGLGKLKARGARVDLGQPDPHRLLSAIADDWIGITPGTDGLLILALIHLLMAAGKIDLDYLAALDQRRPCWSIEDPDAPDIGMLLRDERRPARWSWDRARSKPVAAGTPTASSPRLPAPINVGPTHAMPVFQLHGRRIPRPGTTRPRPSPPACGLDPPRIRRLAAELARVAFDEADHDRPPLDRLPRRRATRR